MKKSISFAMAMGWVFSLSFAGPITTVPWNGHPGAASFTFDDGLHSQTTNLAFLNSMSDVQVTFFVCTNSMDFSTNSAPHMEYASKGHEIGNHTANHKNLTETSDYNTEISGAASKLRGMKRSDGSSLQVTSLATPYCAQNQNAKNAINQEHFINRGCGGSGITGWNTEPDWMQIDSHYWQASSSVQQFQGSLDQAANGSWHVQLNHGVGGDWDAISANDIKTLIQYAVTKNLWVASFSTVGAYLRAHFTIDKATSTTTSTGFKVTWTSPHAHMPKSVPLRVNIEGASGKTVMQKGVAIPANSDGTYTIEFMDLELEVTSAAAPPTSSSATQPTSSSAGQPQPGSSASTATSAVSITVEMEDYDVGGEGLTYSDLNGESEGTSYRTDDAGVVSVGTGYGIGYTMAGEWFNYTVDVACQGQYSVVARAATGNASTTRFSVSVDNVAGSVAVDVPSTGDWNTYTEVEGSGTLNLGSGKNVVKVSIDQSYVNVDWIKLTSDNAQCPALIATRPHLDLSKAPVKCEIFDVKGQQLKAKTFSATSAQQMWQDMSAGLKPGVYLMRYGTGNNARMIKVRK
jgi:peptidoglycan/xylan/chitin deacetylase (PgdA/CDA1 family)